MTDATEAKPMTLNPDGTWTGGDEIAWTPEDAAKLRAALDEPQRRAELYAKAEAGLNEATDRLTAQRDALTDLAGRLGSGEAGTLTPGETAIVADAVGAALLRIARDEMTEVVARDRMLGLTPSGGWDAGSRSLFIGMGRIV